MKIVVCFKSVPFDESIGVNPDRTLNLSNASWEIGKYDLNAVEAGAQMAEKTGGTVVALTANGEIASNSKLKKSILSRGPAELFAVQDESLVGADSFTIAQTLKSAIDKIGDVDMVLCGEGSGDVYAQQVGNTIGALLGWTTLNAVSHIDYENDELYVDRNVSDGVEKLKVKLPLVLSVTADINTPRVSGLKQIMAAGKKPLTVWSLSDIAPIDKAVCQTLSILAPVQGERKQILLTGDSDEVVEEFVGYIKKSM